MIEARVRNIDWADALFLGNFSPEQIPQLPNLFQAFPTYDGENSGFRFMMAQFVCGDDDGVYFEIVLEEAS